MNISYSINILNHRVCDFILSYLFLFYLILHHIILLYLFSIILILLLTYFYIFYSYPNTCIGNIINYYDNDNNININHIIINPFKSKSNRIFLYVVYSCVSTVRALDEKFKLFMVIYFMTKFLHK